MIYDISQELFSCNVYPGDPKPELNRISDMEKGGLYNLSSFSMCAHNGTHCDAPRHFIKAGKTIDQMGLEPFVGDCYVAGMNGDVLKDDALSILRRAEEAGAGKRILIAGDATVTEEAAHVFADAGVLLVGNESQSVGPADAPMQVHLILLGNDCVLLEGIVLDGIEEGKYFLSAAPLNLGGCEGSPCRAYLIDTKE